MPVSFTLNRVTALHTDNDADGYADAGDVLRHILTITNTGDTDATAVVLNDLLGGSTETGLMNISPIAFNDAFTAVGNTALRVGGAANIGSGPSSQVAGNLLANDVGSTIIGVGALAADDVTGFTITVVTAGDSAHGTYNIFADGSFNYIGDAGYTGLDTFTYTITDAGIDGIAGNADDTSSTATVTITIANQVWYVDNNAAAGGDGTSWHPFDSLSDVTGASGPDVAGSIIYVGTGSGSYDGGITLLNNQTLHGAGTALTVGGFNLAGAGTDPTIVNTGATNGTHGVVLASGNTLTGFTVGNTGGFDIANTTTSTVGTLNISNVDLTGTGGLFRADSGGALNVTFDSAGTTSAAGNGVQLGGALTGSFTITTGAISGVAGTDLLIAGGTETVAIGASITGNTGGSIDIGTHNGNVTLSGAINITGGTGISVHNNTGGTIAFTNASKVVSTGVGNAVDLDTNAGTTINFTNGGLDLDTTSGTAFDASGGGTISISGSGNSATTTTGTAISLNGVTVGASGVTFATATTNGAANGILIDNVSQAAGSTGIDVLGGAIVNASVRGVDINNSSADITVNSAISTTAAGRSVEVTNSGSTAAGGSTINFGGSIDDNGLGINLDNNDQNTNGATINFTGGLDIDTATSTGFNAVNGGTVNVTGSNNSINSVSATALNVANTTIGTSDLNFHDISSGNNTAAADPVSGIILNNTGTSGSLTVAGDGGGANNGSGGTIQHATGDGISLTNTMDVNLGYMNVINNLGDGIGGSTINGFVLNRLTISGNGNDAATDESGINISGLTGTASNGLHPTGIFNTVVSNNHEFEIFINNTSGQLVNFQLSGSTISSNGLPINGAVSSPHGNLVNFAGSGTSQMGISVVNTTFTGNWNAASPPATITGTGLHVDSSGTSMMASVTGSTFTNNNAGINMSTGPGSTALTYLISGNTFTGQRSTAINDFQNGNSPFTRTINGTIQNNNIGTAGVVGSGSMIGNGISIGNEGAVNATYLITGNHVQRIGTGPGNGFEAIVVNVGLGGQATGGGTTNLTITNNNIHDVANSRGLVIQDNQDSGFAPFPTIFANISGNTFGPNIAGQAGNGQFMRIRELSGNVRITQAAATAAANAAELDDANGFNDTTKISISGGVSFSQGTPPLPSSPSLPLLAPGTPAPTSESLSNNDPNGSNLTDGGKSAGDGTGGELPTPGGSTPPPNPGPTVVDDGVLSQAELNLIVNAAIDRWAAAGATPDQIEAMRAVIFSVEDLEGLYLGSSTIGRVTIDSNAAGFSWFVDSTPGDDNEYTGSGTRLTAEPGTEAAVRIDLLTTVMHELGHQIGLGDDYNPAETDELMYGTINPGERRLPGNDDLAGAGGTPPTGIAFALSPVNLGTIPAGRTVTVQWDSTVNAFFNQIVPTFNNTSNVSGGNFVTTFSNTEAIGPNGTPTPTFVVFDSLTLGNLVFFDANNNGTFDGADTGINGVALTLFADTNANGVFDSGVDVQLATTTTAGGGLYSFANLAPGNYIVRIDAANFTAGGALVGRLTATGGADPDDNANNDDNGVNAAGGIVVSQAITLSMNGETTADGTGQLDINNSLDFGFIQLNQPPVNTVPGTQTINEDATLTFTGGTAISVNDPDVGAGNLTVTLSVLNGQLTLSGTAGLAFSNGDGTDDTSMTFSGTQAAVNAALAGLLYETTQDYNGSDTLTIVTNDNGNTGSDPGTSGGPADEEDTDSVTINITAVADIVTDTPTVGEDSGANNLDLLGNDTFENAGRAITAVGAALHGTTSINDNGTALDATDDFVVYTPDADYNGADTFTYTVTSGGVTEVGTVNVTVTAVADIADDNPSTAEDTAVNVLVQANDTFENAGHSITNVGAALHGTAVLNDNGTAGDATDDYIVYTPNADYNGSDSFTYQVTSGGIVETATVTVTITAVADIADDSVGVIQDTVDNALDLLANDTFESPGRAITAVGAALHGTTAIDDNGTAGDATDDFVTYTPTGGYIGPDSFTYTVTSGGVMETATVTVNVAAANLAPAVDLNTGAGGIDDTNLYVENGAPSGIGVAIDVSDPDAGDNIESATITITDPEAGDLLSVTLPLPPGIMVDTVNSTATTLILIGSATPAAYASALGQVGYENTTNDPTDHGTNTNRVITVVVNDGALDSPAATMTMNIATDDDPGVAQDDDFLTDEATGVSGSLFADNSHGVDTDPDSALAIATVNNAAFTFGVQFALPSGALLTVNADGTFDYDPNGFFDPTPTAGSGAVNQPDHDSFTYELVGGSQATVTITIDGLDTDDTLIGTAGNDTLDGGAGVDDMSGLAGDDEYLVDNAGDVVHEAIGGGDDRVSTTVSYSLLAGSEVEHLEAEDLSGVTNLTLTGNEFGQTIIGNNGDNFLFGLGGNDTLAGQGGNDFLIGGTGDDLMYGDLGNDTYYVDSIADSVSEAVGGGTDRIAAAVSYILDATAEVETLEAVNLSDTNALNLIANDFNNTVIGNDGVNLLIGGGGADVLIGLGGGDFLVGGTGIDTMSGGAGDDTYYVDDSADVVSEQTAEGTDRIAATVSYVLDATAEVETLESTNLSSTNAMDLTGNDFGQTIIGNDGANILRGNGGADTLVGGGGDDFLVGGSGADTMGGNAGNDTYYVDDAGDIVHEAIGEGTDRIATSVSFTLAGGVGVELVEALNSADTTALNLTGNELDNALVGNAGVNILNGGDGDDALVGLGGADIFRFNTALGPDNVDVIGDFVHLTDKIELDNAIFDQLVDGALPAGLFHVGPSANADDQRIIYDNTTGNLYYDVDGSGIEAQVLFATLQGLPTLTASDFTVI